MEPHSRDHPQALRRKGLTLEKVGNGAKVRNDSNEGARRTRRSQTRAPRKRTLVPEEEVRRYALCAQHASPAQSRSSPAPVPPEEFWLSASANLERYSE